MSSSTKEHTPNNDFRGRLPALIALVVAGEAIFLLPFVIPRVFRPTYLEVFGITNLELGTFYSAYGTVAILAYLLGGPLADRFAAHKLMAWALGLTAAGGILLSLIPDPTGLFWLYGSWGISTILLFWAPMLRATRILGGELRQGLAFGILDGGRGATAAITGTLAVGVLALFLPDTKTAATIEELSWAFRQVILFFTAVVVLAMVLVLAILRKTLPTGHAPAPKPVLQDLGRMARTPEVWIQAAIILCAYSGYRVADDFSLLAKDALEADDVQAATVGAMGLWLRPIAAVGAGWLADKVSASMTTLGCFVCMILGGILLVFGPVESHPLTLVLLTITSTAVGVYAIRGTYFAIMQEGAIPLHATGAAVGLASMIGYLPDIYMAPTMGVLLDSYPGLQGHRYVFMLLIGFAVLGLLLTVVFRRVSRSGATTTDA